MLVRFGFKNFLSYRDWNAFSMVAGKFTRHASHVCSCNGKGVLRSSFVFGANAGGKSGFVKAIDFGRRIVLEGVQPMGMDTLHFRLGREINPVGVFQYDIFADGRLYSYSFAIDYRRAVIVDECLSRMDGTNEICIFHRGFKKDASHAVLPFIETDLELSSADKTRFDIYAEDFTGRAMRRELFLRDIAKREKAAKNFAQDAVKVIQWFMRLRVIFPETKFVGLPSYALGRKESDAWSVMMNHFDTGIDRLVEEEVDVEKFWEQIPIALRDRLKADVMEGLTSRGGTSIVSVNNGISSYVFSYRDGKIMIKKTKEDHGNPHDLFERAEESDGTIRLFDLIPLRENWRRQGVVVIDEIDRSLHTKATQEFIRLFLEDQEARQAQLIATTHDGNLLDLDLLRQDEIWFAERLQDKSTRLYSLAQFKARFDKDIRKDYLLGRYGALPIFDMLTRTEE